MAASYLQTGEPVENPESGVITDGLFHLFRVGIALGNEKKKNDMPQTGAFHMADEEKLPFLHAGAGRAGENGAEESPYFSRKKGAVLFRAGNVLGMQE